jgi:hypothetical protein
MDALEGFAANHAPLHQQRFATRASRLSAALAVRVTARRPSSKAVV